MELFLSNKKGLIYYLLLLIVLVSWTNSESLPSMPLRLAFMCAVVLPLWVRKSKSFPVLFFPFVIISASSYAVSYMPVDGLYIFVTVLLSLVILGRNGGKHLKIPNSFKLLCFLSMFMDTFFSSDVTSVFNWLSIIIVAESFLSINDFQKLNSFTFSLAVISLVLSLEFIFVGNKFMTVVNTIDGVLDRKGWTDPNYFGSILGFGIFASLVELMTNKSNSKIIRYFYFFVIVVSLYTLFGTASRGAVIALICSSLILLFICPLSNTYRIGIISFSVLVLFIMFKLHMLDLLILRFLSDEGDAGGRMEIWIPRLNAFFYECSPMQWLFGLGTDKAMRLGTGQFIGFHNDYLSILVKYGMIGFFCLIGLLVKPIMSCKNKKGIVFAGIVYMSVCMFSIEPFTGGQWGCLYFYLYVLLLSQVRNERYL